MSLSCRSRAKRIVPVQDRSPLGPWCGRSVSSCLSPTPQCYRAPAVASSPPCASQRGRQEGRTVTYRPLVSPKSFGRGLGEKAGNGWLFMVRERGGKGGFLEGSREEGGGGGGEASGEVTVEAEWWVSGASSRNTGGGEGASAAERPDGRRALRWVHFEGGTSGRALRSVHFGRGGRSSPPDSLPTSRSAPPCPPSILTPPLLRGRGGGAAPTVSYRFPSTSLGAGLASLGMTALGAGGRVVRSPGRLSGGFRERAPETPGGEGGSAAGLARQGGKACRYLAVRVCMGTWYPRSGLKITAIIAVSAVATTFSTSGSRPITSIM